MSGVRNSQQDVDIDIGRLFVAVWEKRSKVLLATAVVTGLAFLGTSLIKPDYQSETRVLIELRDTSMAKNDVNNNTVSQPQLDDLGIASQVQLMKSVDLIKTVARDMKLYDLEEFNDYQGAFAHVLAALGLGNSNADVPPEERVLNAFKEKLVVFQAEKSRVIGIQFTSKDPKLAAAIPNKIADVFLSLQSGAKLDTNTETSKWLEPEIADLRKKVEDAEAKVAEYRKNSDLLPTSKDNSFAEQQLNDISLELTKVRSEYATAQARAENVKNALATGAKVDTLTEVMASQTIQRLKENEMNIVSRISDLAVTLMESHPQIKGLRAQLVGVRAQIKNESQRVAASLENEARIGKEREKVLLDQLTQLKAQSAKAGENMVTLKSLEREATAQRDLLETYLARYRQATSRTGENTTPADARVVSNATVPTEVFFPKKIPITIIAAIGTLVVSSIVIMLGELFSGSALQPVLTPVSARREDEPHMTQAKAAPVRSVKKDPVPDYAKNRTQKRQADLGPDRITRPAAIKIEEPADMAVVEEDLANEWDVQQPHPADDKPAMSRADFQPVLSSDNSRRPAPTAYVKEPDATSNYSVAQVAHYLALSKLSVAFCLSPTGNNGSLATVILARNLSDRGLKAILIDVSGNDVATKLMTETGNLPGITDLLTGQSTIAGSIHADPMSNAHIIPAGNANPDDAAQSFDRLPMIVDALTGAYDMILVDCGGLDLDDVLHLTQNLDVEIILSVPSGDRLDVAGTLMQMDKAGFADVVLMEMQKSDKLGEFSRRAA